VKSSSVVADLAESVDVEMPIAGEVRAVCHDGKAAGDALVDLLQRRAGREAD
jgi:glycerol-3-phosphate dehydrogenase